MRPQRPLGTRFVLVDTSAFFAIFDQRDAFHQTANAVLSEVTRLRRRLVTTNFLVAETHALIIRRRGGVQARRFLRELRISDTEIIRINEEDEARALEIIFQYEDKDFSYVDATSFAVMERLGIDEGFSFDRHFRQYGWRMLPERLA